MGTSTDADVSLKDINHLIAVVRQHHVPAIFVEVAINPKILTQLAADLGIRIGGHLYTDSFGPAGSEADSYLGMMRFNALNMKNALGSVETNIPEGFAIGENLTFLLLVILAFSLAYFWVWRKVYPEYPMVANWKHYTLQIENLSVMVERKMILSNLYLQLKPGRLYGILGANGSGKSTLVKTMVGLYEPVSGTIQLDGMPIRQFLRKIAYLPQKEEFDMDFPATIEDVVRLGFFPENRGKGGLLPHQRTQMETVLHQLEIYHLKDRQIAQLSGGQFQRTLLARALCQKAEILILDEPFVGVDHATEEIIMDLLRSLVREGKMVLMVHHDLTKVRAYFDELVMINQRIVAHGPVSEVFTEENIRATYSGKVTLLQKALQLIPPRQKG
jgi:ABC-type Mn2+/Zn2+ transport system ATPase subunit